MPQIKSCVRCGAVLPTGDASFSIEPPRAGKWEKRLRIASVIRTVNRFFGGCFAFGGWIGNGFHRLGLRMFDAIPLQDTNVNLAAAFWRGIVPGLPQWFLGRNRMAKFFFFSWLALIVLTFLTLGTTLSTVLLSLLITCHLVSLIDFAWTVCSSRDDRIALTAIMLIGAVLLMYVPTSSLLWSNIGMVRLARLGVAAGTLREGDTLLYRMSWSVIQPHVGETVLYTSPTVQYNVDHSNNRFEGNMFDRVLAVGGQKVEWREGKLFVDGELSTVTPLFPRTLPDMSFTVPEGQFHVVPGVAFLLVGRRGNQWLREPPDAATWQQICLVPNRAVYGVVWGVRRSLFEFVDIP